MTPGEHGRRAESILHGGGGFVGRVVRTTLAPVELLYRFGAGVHAGLYDRGLREPQRIDIPVISVGNITVGGAGKTPFSAWVVDRLLERERTPALVHGGYGLDEPKLHRQWHPDVQIVVDRDRVAAAATAMTAGADVIVLDDGFQHRRLHRDLDIVLVAAESWTPKPRLLPRGPWREPVRSLERADVVVVTRKVASEEEARAVADRLALRLPDVPVSRAAILPEGWAGAEQRASTPPTPALAVAGIAAPELFLRNASEAGAVVESTLLFPDHHGYTAADVSRIRSVAAGRPIVTTEKDAVKLELFGLAGWLWILRQSVTIEAGMPVLRHLLDIALSRQ